MKITLTNAWYKTSCTVIARGDPVNLFKKKGYKISYTTYKRVVKKLNPGKLGIMFNSPCYKDDNYHLMKYNNEYFILILG